MNVYKNVMEMLVEQEVERQLLTMSPRAASHVNRLELVAYALNQLPSLYATSKRGLQYQLHAGKQKYAEQIAQAVHQAIAAVNRDPLRTSAPLKLKEPRVIQPVMAQLRKLLHNEQLSWDTLPKAIELALSSTAASMDSMSSGTPSSIGNYRRPGAYNRTTSSPYPANSYSGFPEGDETAALPETPSHSRPATASASTYSQEDVLSWDDPFFR